MLKNTEVNLWTTAISANFYPKRKIKGVEHYFKSCDCTCIPESLQYLALNIENHIEINF